MPPRALALLSSRALALSLPLIASQPILSLFLYSRTKQTKPGSSAFPKRRILLQDSSSTSSSSGDAGVFADSSTSFSNLITGADDSLNRVEASPAVALAESPLSDAELCAVSKQVRRRRRRWKKSREKEKKLENGGLSFLFFFSNFSHPQPLHTTQHQPTQIYGSVPPECSNQPQIKVKTLPVRLGPVEEPLSLGVSEEGAITASGGNPPDVDASEWDPVTAERIDSSSSSSKSSKLSSGAVAGIVVGAVAVFAAGAVAVAVSKKKRAARSAAGLAAARVGTSSSR